MTNEEQHPMQKFEKLISEHPGRDWFLSRAAYKNLIQGVDSWSYPEDISDFIFKGIRVYVDDRIPVDFELDLFTEEDYND